jgi:choline dehydrogenase
MPQNTDYDYVVIGAGAAGSIVAAEAARAGHSVLLLEVGLPVSPKNRDVWDPTRWNNLLSDPAFEMGYTSTPQANLANQKKNLLQSRGTGGCQIHNAMVYVRGGRATYDHWEAKLGCAGWGYESLLPHFEAIESKLRIVTAERDPFSDSIIEAAGRLGYPANPDYNGGAGEYGAVRFQFTIEETPKDGLRRTTTFEKYIGEADLPTLTVETGVSVMRLILQQGMETGVEYSDAEGKQTTVYARREVVLSAGAIATPTILLRSGVGDADAVRAHDIDLAHHLPEVGRNFYDDLGLGFPAFAAADLPPTPYGFAGAGIFASDRGNPPPDPSAFGAINLEMQIATSSMAGPSHAWHPSYALIGVSAMHLESRGTVRLDPADPHGHPLVDPAWLTAPGDLDRCRAALHLCNQIAWDAELMEKWRWIPLPILSPDEWIALTGTTVQHYVGSCRMGTGPENSVVGPDLRVHGLSGVRVIDASAAPTPVSGNTAGVSMVIGAKGAEMLLSGG